MNGFERGLILAENSRMLALNWLIKIVHRALREAETRSVPAFSVRWFFVTHKDEPHTAVQKIWKNHSQAASAVGND